MEYKFKGEKGSRQVVKTIDIQEESYEALQKMLSTGESMTEDVCGPLIEDTYKIFGGNCYDILVSIAVRHLIIGVVTELEEKDFLSMEGEKACDEISEALFPSMCFVRNDDGDYEEELRFFETNIDEVIENVAPCLADIQRHIFTENLKEAVKTDNRPVGEIALGILMYIGSETCAEDSSSQTKE